MKIGLPGYISGRYCWGYTLYPSSGMEHVISEGMFISTLV
jgi:hypothetical protein